jgi:hypothetical protein
MPTITLRVVMNVFESKVPERKREFTESLIYNTAQTGLEVLRLDKQERPTFAEMFDLGCSNGYLGMVCMCCSDIMLMSVLQSVLMPVGEAWVVSPWEKNLGEVYPPLRTSTPRSFFLRAGGPKPEMDFPIGLAGSASRLAYQLQQAGYVVKNPGKRVMTLHNHLNQGGLSGTRVFGPYLCIDPS